MTDKEIKKTVLKVSVITICVNVLLTGFKLAAGFIGNSAAMISDAVHSASDVISTVVVIVGAVISSKPTDSRHQYGHERLECVASVILAVLLFATGVFIGYDGISKLISGSYREITPPGNIALIAAAVSIAVKELMFWFTYVNSKKTGSLSLKADAWHHRSDALSSIGSLLGIGATLLFSMPVFDVVASLVICLFIFKVAIGIFLEAVNKMVDKSCPEDVEKKMNDIILAIDGVLKVDELKTRMFGNKIYVDVEIGVLEDLPLKYAHAIAENAHSAIEAFDERVKHCMVHVNPVAGETKKPETETEQSD